MKSLVPLPISLDKKRELIKYLCDKFRYAVTSRTNQVDGKYKRWMDIYAGKPKEAQRSTPWPNASNFIPQVTRMHTDIMAARVIGLMFGTKPFWRPETFFEVPHEWTEELGKWIEYESFYNIGLYDPMDKIISRGFKAGTVFAKAWWDTEDVYLGGLTSEDTGEFSETHRL